MDSLGKTSQWAHVEAPVEETGNNITSSQTTVNVLPAMVNSDSIKKQGAQNDGDNLEKNISVECDGTMSQMMLDLTDAVGPPQHENNQYEIVKDLLDTELPSTSTDEGAHEEPRAASKHSRRCLKGVRKHIRNMFQTLCSCFPMTYRERTPSR